MRVKSLDVLAVGNAVVDIFGQCDDDFLQANGIEKGVMTLLDARPDQQGFTPHLTRSARRN